MDYAAATAALTATYAPRIAAVQGTARSDRVVARDAAIRKLARRREAERTAGSYMGRIGKWLAPAFAPIGIGWRGGVALLTGFVAKEIVVSTLGVLYAVDEKTDAAALSRSLRESGMTPLSALAMMVFVLLYLPCLATIGAIRRETGSPPWMWFSIVYGTAMAWLAAFFVYQGGHLIGFS